jgi:hypothetical protein
MTTLTISPKHKDAVLRGMVERLISDGYVLDRNYRGIGKIYKNPKWLTLLDLQRLIAAGFVEERIYGDGKPRYFVNPEFLPASQPSALARFGDTHPLISKMSARELNAVLTSGIPHGYAETGEMLVGVFHERAGQHAGGTCEICDLPKLNRWAQAWLEKNAEATK